MKIPASDTKMNVRLMIDTIVEATSKLTRILELGQIFLVNLKRLLILKTQITSFILQSYKILPNPWNRNRNQKQAVSLMMIDDHVCNLSFN